MREKTLTEVDDLELARNLFHAGDYHDAESAVDAVLDGPVISGDAKFAALLLKASIYSETNRLNGSLEVLKSAGPLLDAAPASQKARFYGQRAHVRVKLGHTDGPLVDYEAARFWAQEAGDKFSEASIRNNLAKRYGDSGRIEEALKESDAAIMMILELDQEIYLGRFYDQRAQILNDRGMFSEALQFSEQAIRLLEGHPAFPEASDTHARALRGVGTAYLNRLDPITRFRVSRTICKSLDIPLDPEIIQMAMERSDGNVYRAAILLDIKHPSLLESIKRHGLQDLQHRRHLKSIIKK